MYVDYKITTWSRVHFSDDADPKEIIKIIQEEGLREIFDEELGFVRQEILYDTDEEITPEENGGCSTIEVYEINNPVDKLIWSNGKD